MQRISSTALRKDFGKWLDVATTEPVIITRYGRNTLVLLSEEMYQNLRESHEARAHNAGEQNTSAVSDA